MDQTYTKKLLIIIGLSICISSCNSNRDLHDQIIGEWAFDANASRPFLEESLKLSQMNSANQEQWNKLLQDTWGKMRISFAKETMMLYTGQKPVEAGSYKVKESVGNTLILIDAEASKGYGKEVYVTVTFKSDVLIQVSFSSSVGNMNNLMWKRQ